MTKKELLENESFKALPDDAEIVFNNSTDRLLVFAKHEEIKED